LYVKPEGLAEPNAHALHQGAAADGLLMAAIPAGTVLGAITVTRLVSPSRRLQVIGWLAILATAPLIGSAFRPPLPVVLVLWAATGAGSGYQAVAVAAFARRIPDSGRAAAMGVAGSGLLAAQGIGFLVGGAAAGLFGPQAAVAWAGAAGGHPLTNCRRPAPRSHLRTQTTPHAPSNDCSELFSAPGPALAPLPCCGWLPPRCRRQRWPPGIVVGG
jgi:MFS family permease